MGGGRPCIESVRDGRVRWYHFAQSHRIYFSERFCGHIREGDRRVSWWIGARTGMNFKDDCDRIAAEILDPLKGQDNPFRSRFERVECPGQLAEEEGRNLLPVREIVHLRTKSDHGCGAR